MSRRTRLVIAAVCLAAFGLRLGTIAAFDLQPFRAYGHPCQGSHDYHGCLRFLHHEEKVGAGGDVLYYHDQAQLLLEGKAFIDPIAYYTTGAVRQSASHPPLYTVLLAGEDLIGLRSIDAQKLFGSVIGTLTVLVVALLARRLLADFNDARGRRGTSSSGDMAALVAGLLAAFYPGMWIFDGTGMAESLSILVVAYLLHESYRYLSQPSLKKAAWVGFVAALAAYSRSELALLAVIMVLPLALLHPGPAGKWRTAAVSLGAVTLALAPWFGFNLARFSQPELLSTQFGTTLMVSNCPAVYYGPFTGFWDQPSCEKYAVHHGKPPPPKSADESVVDAYWRQKGIDFMKAHLGRFPLVLLAREGRVWWLYRPSQQAMLNSFIEQWDLGASQLFRWSFYPLALLAAYGVVLAKRRLGLIVFPLLAPVVVVCLAVLLTYGTTRFQSSAEPSLVVLASLAVTCFLSKLPSSKGRAHAAATPDDCYANAVAN
jgi:hypothetical protein